MKVEYIELACVKGAHTEVQRCWRMFFMPLIRLFAQTQPCAVEIIILAKGLQI